LFGLAIHLSARSKAAANEAVTIPEHSAAMNPCDLASLLQGAEVIADRAFRYIQALGQLGDLDA
jgi:hypothetical protein